MKTKLVPLALAAFSGLIAVDNQASAQAWMLTSAPTNVVWYSVVSSADGKTLIAGSSLGLGIGQGNGIDISTDSGATWIHAFSNDCFSVASSADGTELAAVVAIPPYFPPFSSIVLSTNSGASWTTNWLAPYSQGVVASSADGTKMAMTVGLSAYYTSGRIYVSTNSGITWTQTSAPYGAWIAIASSANGTKLAALNFGGCVFTSTNSGITWVPQTNSTRKPWSSIASSADGVKLVASAANGYFGINSGYGGIFTSADSGVTWTQTSLSTNVSWDSVVSSADGAKLMAFGNGVFISTNSGETWAQANVLGSRLAMSADGNQLVAGQNVEGIYISKAILAPSISVKSSSKNLNFSWVIPSTNFALQENCDLTTSNWIDVNIIPTFNFTNLQYEVMVLPTNSQNFYRLKSP
jgi:hypothetical protein